MPFTYKGTKYESCTRVANENHLWCSLTPDFDKDGLWANCLCHFPDHSLDSLSEEGERASFQTMGWGMLTSFRLMTGDGFGDIFADVLASAETVGGYTFVMGIFLVLWHLFAYVFLQAAFLAFAFEYFSFASWQDHWAGRPHLAGLFSLFFDSIFGETGLVQKMLDPALVKVTAWLQYAYEELRNSFSSRVQPIKEEGVAEDKLPSILSHGGEATPAIQSWWKNTPVISSSPTDEDRTDGDDDVSFSTKSADTGGNFIRHADHFTKPADEGETEAAGEVASPTVQVKNSRWAAVRFMMDAQKDGVVEPIHGPGVGMQLKKKKAMSIQEASATLLALHARDDDAASQSNDAQQTGRQLQVSSRLKFSTER